MSWPVPRFPPRATAAMLSAWATKSRRFMPLALARSGRDERRRDTDLRVLRPGTRHQTRPDAGAAREILAVDRVHVLVVLHVAEVDVPRDDVVERQPGRLEDVDMVPRHL